MTLTVAIIGRPNVGKSTLFNRLLGRRLALVDDAPGVTRDRIVGEGRIGTLRFDVIDTAGLEGPDEALSGRLRQQVEAALAQADVGLFLIDARVGVTPVDAELADWLRRQSKPVLLVANKAEGRAAEATAAEAWGLGLGEPLLISAQHGEGLLDLADALRRHVDDAPAADGDGEEADGPLRLVVCGRPNVGKSSLINRLLDDERLLTGPEPGLTRDAVSVAWSWRGRRVELVDTAGLRRRARVAPGLEKMSTAASLAAIRRAHVALLMVDATMPLEKQDLTIANRVIDEGRALVVALNKWDLVEERAAALRAIRDRLEAKLPQIKGVACLPVSVRTGRGVERLPDAVLKAYERWNLRVPTPALNRWLAAALEAHPPPLVEGRRLKVRYATQAQSRPPTFVLFANKPDGMPKAYLRYLSAGLREAFDLPGVPLRLKLRAGDNPYAP